MRTNEILKVNGCVVKDCDSGLPLAVLHERGEYIEVERLPACTIGVFFYILDYVRELGFDVR